MYYLTLNCHNSTVLCLCENSCKVQKQLPQLPLSTFSTQVLPSQSVESAFKKIPVEHKAQPTQSHSTNTKTPNTPTHATASKPPYHHSSFVEGAAGGKGWYQQEPSRQRSRSFHLPWQSQSKVSVYSCMCQHIVHTG